MKLPAKLKTTISANANRILFRATAFFVAASSYWVKVIKTGVFAIGFIMAK
ncbi:hypothetical protein C5S53_13985 [Methanophagales archaeon]|nr:hypothetical protein C5S53_13985 [Methanophagales archaeon]